MAETVKREYDASTGKWELRHTKGEGAEPEEAKKEMERRSAAGLGSLEKKAKGPMPKQKTGESASAYGERLRKWRAGELDEEAEIVSRAMRQKDQ